MQWVFSWTTIRIIYFHVQSLDSPESRQTAKEGNESKGRNGQNGQRDSTKESHRIAHRDSLFRTIYVK